MSNRLTPPPATRRDFLGLSGIWVAATAVFGSLLGMLRLPMPRVTPEAASRFRIGKPEDFAAGSEKILKDRNLLVRSTPQGLAALSLVCPHLGCIVAPSDHSFHCPCHGSRFDSTGNVTGGPAPRGLRWLEISLGPDGSLLVDTNREVRPGTYYMV